MTSILNSRSTAHDFTMIHELMNRVRELLNCSCVFCKRHDREFVGGTDQCPTFATDRNQSHIVRKHRRTDFQTTGTPVNVARMILVFTICRAASHQSILTVPDSELRGSENSESRDPYCRCSVCERKENIDPAGRWATERPELASIHPA